MQTAQVAFRQFKQALVARDAFATIQEGQQLIVFLRTCREHGSEHSAGLFRIHTTLRCKWRRGKLLQKEGYFQRC